MQSKIYIHNPFFVYVFEGRENLGVILWLYIFRAFEYKLLFLLLSRGMIRDLGAKIMEWWLRKELTKTD